MKFNYHVCARIWPNPCEDGWVIVYTTDNQVNLQLSMYICVIDLHNVSYLFY